MERTKAEAVLEAILFTMGDSVEVKSLAEVIEEDVKTTKEILKGMEKRYAKSDRGIALTWFDDAVRRRGNQDVLHGGHAFQEALSPE